MSYENICTLLKTREYSCSTTELESMPVSKLWVLAELIWSSISSTLPFRGSFFAQTSFGCFTVLSDPEKVLSLIEYMLVECDTLTILASQESVKQLGQKEMWLTAKLERTRRIGTSKFGKVFENCCEMQEKIRIAEKRDTLETINLEKDNILKSMRKIDIEELRERMGPKLIELNKLRLEGKFEAKNAERIHRIIQVLSLLS